MTKKTIKTNTPYKVRPRSWYCEDGRWWQGAPHWKQLRWDVDLVYRAEQRRERMSEGVAYYRVPPR